MSYVFEPSDLHEVVCEHLELPLDEMFARIAQSLAERYPGQVDFTREWTFSNAGGAMGQFTLLHASLREYLSFFGSPVDSGGHSGRYSFADHYAFILDGQMWCYGEGDLVRKEYRKGDIGHVPPGAAKCYRMVDHGWMLEYVRGPVATMLPFGLFDSLFSTLDYKTVFRTIRLFTRHTLRSHKMRSRARFKSKREQP